MMWKKSAFIFLSLTIFSFSSLTHSAFFQKTPEQLAPRSDLTPLAKANNANYLVADINGLRELLLTSDEVDVELPLPNGSTTVYHFELSPIAAQELLEKYPEIRTFVGTDTSNSTNTGRFSISPIGFHGMFRHNGEAIFIDPQYKDSSQYLSYKAADAVNLNPKVADIVEKPSFLEDYQRPLQLQARDGGSDGTLRTYRLAVAATGEYSQFFSDPLVDSPATMRANGLAAIVTAINRVNEIFGRDLNISFQLIGNNDDIVYVDPTSDPYSNSTSLDIWANQDNLDTISVIGGSSAYDIGHVFGTGSGGLATLGSVCDDTLKARGVSLLDKPTTDAFYVDYVAHEIGHQFGANHTFNGTAGACIGNRNASTAYEAGSGSTIMAYSGICGVEDLQTNSDPYFHAGSIAEINRFITTGQISTDGASFTNPSIVGCAATSVPANNLPDVSAGSDYVIPANTPIYLSGVGTDADPDPLTYTWEQMDVGTASASPDDWLDNGNRTITRSFEPSSTGNDRYIPDIGVYIDRADTDVYPNGETLPSTDRDLTFRLTVRDDNGGTAYEDKILTVTTSAGPFDLRTPEDDDVWTQGTTVVTWDVANTNEAPVNCSQVNIYYNGDIVDGTDDYSATSFSTALALAEPNDGEALVTTPAVASIYGRVLITCADGAFYTMSEEAFEVSASSSVIVSSVSNINRSEGSSFVFDVTMSAVPTGDETVDFSILYSSAGASDLGGYSFSAGITDNGDGTITVPTGTVTFTVTVSTSQDSIAEGDEIFIVTVGSATGIGTILDDDTASSGSSSCSSGTYGGPYESVCQSSSGGGSSGYALLLLLVLLAAAKIRKNII